MALDDKDIMLITESFAKVAAISDQAAALFYGRLFEIAPETEVLFNNADMTQQGRKLMQTIGLAVGALGRLDAVVPQIQDLGKRHIAYGVTKEQYAVVGESLLWTLEQGLGDDFTPETKEAWAKVYGVLAEVATSAYDN